MINIRPISNHDETKTHTHHICLYQNSVKNDINRTIPVQLLVRITQVPLPSNLACTRSQITSHEANRIRLEKSEYALLGETFPVMSNSLLPFTSTSEHFSEIVNFGGEHTRVEYFDDDGFVCVCVRVHWGIRTDTRIHCRAVPRSIFGPQPVIGL